MIHHGAALRALVPAWDFSIFRDWRQGDFSRFSPKEQHLLTAARELSRTPPFLEEATFQALRKDGWNDRALSQIVQIVAYFHYVNRLMIALDVEVEPEFEEDLRSLNQMLGGE